MVSRFPGTHLRSEVGAVLLAVLMFGSGIAVVVTAIASRGLAQFGNTANHACFERALTAAESALNWGSAQIDADPEFNTEAPSLEDLIGTAAERQAVIAAADAVDQESVLALPEGEGVFLRAAGSDALYGVGYCSDRDASDRRVRVVRATLSTIAGEAGFWEAYYAFLTDGNVDISGNPTFGDPEFVGADASVHANGDASVSGNVKFFDGCVTWSAGGGGISGGVNISGMCPPDPDRANMPEVPIPPVVPREVWFKSEYDMCPDGVVHAGPAHPSLGWTAEDEPCTGQALGSSPYRGWSYQGFDSSSGHQWKATGNNSVLLGSYYFSHGSVDVSGTQGSSSNPLPVILVAEAEGSCSSNVGGDIKVSGTSGLAPYTAAGVLETNQLLIMAGRDFTWTGNQSVLDKGIVMAHEQMEISGNKSAIGAFVAEDACDTPGSPVSANSVSGNTTIMLDGPKQLDWLSGTGSAEDSYLIVGWVEI